jgi:hypothetical protein
MYTGKVQRTFFGLRQAIRGAVLLPLGRGKEPGEVDFRLEAWYIRLSYLR